MKKKLRQHVRQLLSGISHERVRARSRLAGEKLTALAEFHDAQTVMIYMPTSEEVDTTCIAQAAWAAGKTVLSPRVFVEHRYMEARAIDSLTAGLVVSHYGILEPGDGPAWPCEKIDLIVVPGLAFDRRGGRLGRGAGYYDRFLAQTKGVTCGLCLQEQLVEEVPMFDHDEEIDILVTDQEVLRFDGQA